jgi:acyl-CoA reductase-like NAD-dependent aldehyde dehydrogenase
LISSGLPRGACQVLHTTPDQLDRLVASPLVAHVSFTGSVANGRRVEAAAARGANFKSVGLELGGKDAAYVREDCDPAFAAEEIADGAYFNAGQSCCAIERVYVHENVYDAFVGKLVEVVSVRPLWAFFFTCRVHRRSLRL